MFLKMLDFNEVKTKITLGTIEFKTRKPGNKNTFLMKAGGRFCLFLIMFC